MRFFNVLFLICATSTLPLGAEPGHVFPPIKPEELSKIQAAIPHRGVKPIHPRRLLVFFRTEGYVHDSIPYGNEALKEIGEKTGAYTADFSDDMAVFTPDNLKRYDGLLFMSSTKLAFNDPAQRQAVLDFVKSGKGLIGIHAATDNFYSWPEGQELIGGLFNSHPWHAEDVEAVKLDDPGHPVAAAFGGKGFWINDEIYQIAGPYDRSKVRVLLSLDMSKAQNQRDPKQIVRTDNDFPISWIKNVPGGGRVFYCSLGHNDSIYWTPQVLQYYLAGIQFALGDLAVDATPSAKLSPQPRPALAPESSVPLNPPANTAANPVYVPARYDRQALDASAGGLTLPNRADFRQPPITVECWAKLHDANDFNILVASDTKASSQHWELAAQRGSGNFSAFLPGMGGDFESGKSICDERWHYLVMILEANRVRLFVDGAMVKDAPLNAAAGTPSPGDLAIGKLVEGGFGCDGYIQDVRISGGVRDVSTVPIEPLQREASTLELWSLDGSAAPAPLGISTGLPLYKTIPAATHDQLTPANGWPPAGIYKQWTRSYGNSASNRYVTYTEINKHNVSRLTQAWIYHSGDGNANVQATPIFVDGLLYLPTSGNRMVALEATTGREVWSYTPEKQGNGLEDVPARRGLIYWPGDPGHPARVLFTMGTWIYALDPKTGQPIVSFGEHGRAALPPGGSSVPPVIFKNVLIYPGFANGVFGYDVGTGEKLWTFNTLPRGREFGAATWDSDDQRDGANSWGGMALDESRGIVYMSTGSPKPNFLGMLHTGDNLYGNCLLALDAQTGHRLWYFQDIRHDVWDLDISSPPNLVTVNHDGMKVDAVAAISKVGDTLLLDRVTGKPLFPFRLKRAPNFKIEGDRGALYQPDIQLPEKLIRQEFTLNDVTDRTPDAHEAVKQTMEGASYGWYPPFEEGKPNAYLCLEGAEWSGASVDPSGRLYVCVSEFPWIITVSKVQDPPEPATPLAQAGEKVYMANCVACHHADRGGNGFAPSLIGLENRLKEDDVRLILHKGRNAMPPQPQLNEDQITALCAYVLNVGGTKSSGPPHWTYNGYPKLNDPQGYPGSKPPWGKLVCLDLNTGHIAWQVPFGEYPELTAQGIPKTGTQTNGGPTVTSTGLIFVSGTKDATIGAYDCDTGAELWSHALPLHGTAPAIIYEAKGHEYVALAATGGGKLGGDVGDAWVAFALPEPVTSPPASR